jgi:hypothetical protein
MTVKLIIRKTLAILFTVVVAFFMVTSPVAAQTRAWSEVCVESVDTPSGETQVATIQGLQCLVANVLSVAIQAIGLAGFAMLIVGSFRYMLSGGNSKGAESAKNTVTFAVVGLVVALTAFIILRLLAEFTGVSTILEFRLALPSPTP